MWAFDGETLQRVSDSRFRFAWNERVRVHPGQRHDDGATRSTCTAIFFELVNGHRPATRRASTRSPSQPGGKRDLRPHRRRGGRLGLPLPPALPHARRHVSGRLGHAAGKRRMIRRLGLATALAALPAAGLPTAAWAQHGGHAEHDAPATPDPAPTVTPSSSTNHHGHGEQGGRATSAPAPALSPQPQAIHAGHGDQGGHTTSASAPALTPRPQANHAGHGDQGSHATSAPAPTLTSQPPATHGGHGGHDAHAMPAPAPAPTPQPPANHGADGDHLSHAAPAEAPTLASAPPIGAGTGPARAADAIWGADVMAPSRAALRRDHGAANYARFLAERAEYRLRRGHDGYAWEVQGYYGGDIDRLLAQEQGRGDGQSTGSTRPKCRRSGAMPSAPSSICRPA